MKLIRNILSAPFFFVGILTLAVGTLFKYGITDCINVLEDLDSSYKQIKD